MDQKQLGIRSRAYAAATEPSVPFLSATPNPLFASSSSTPTPTPTSEAHNSSDPDSNNTQNNVGENYQRKSNLAERYLSFIPLAPGVRKLIGENGKFVGINEDYTVVSEYSSPFSHEQPEGGTFRDRKDKEEVPMARTASDFSYSCGKYAGDRWRIIGDAGGKLTLLSSFVLLVLWFSHMHTLDRF